MTKEQKKRIEEFIVNNIKTIEKIHQDIASCENLLGYNTNSYGEIYIKDLNDKLRKQIQNHREYQTKLLDEKNRISESFSKLSHIQKYLINERLVEISDSIMFVKFQIL